MPYQRKPQARASGLARAHGVHAIEPLKDAVLICWRNANASIDDLKDGRLPLKKEAHLNSAVLRIRDGIVNEVVHHECGIGYREMDTAG